jgi:hypothetical protein
VDVTIGTDSHMADCSRRPARPGLSPNFLHASQDAGVIHVRRRHESLTDDVRVALPGLGHGSRRAAQAPFAGHVSLPRVREADPFSLAMAGWKNSSAAASFKKDRFFARRSAGPRQIVTTLHLSTSWLTNS